MQIAEVGVKIDKCISVAQIAKKDPNNSFLDRAKVCSNSILNGQWFYEPGTANNWYGAPLTKVLHSNRMASKHI